MTCYLLLQERDRFGYAGQNRKTKTGIYHRSVGQVPDLPGTSIQFFQHFGYCSAFFIAAASSLFITIQHFHASPGRNLAYPGDQLDDVGNWV
jgi:hypothetical protein